MKFNEVDQFTSPPPFPRLNEYLQQLATISPDTYQVSLSVEIQFHPASKSYEFEWRAYVSGPGFGATKPTAAEAVMDLMASARGKIEANIQEQREKLRKMEESFERAFGKEPEPMETVSTRKLGPFNGEEV